MRDAAFKAVDVFLARLRKHAETLPDTPAPPPATSVDSTVSTEPGAAPLGYGNAASSGGGGGSGMPGGFGVGGGMAGWAIQSLGKQVRLAASCLFPWASTDFAVGLVAWRAGFAHQHHADCLGPAQHFRHGCRRQADVCTTSTVAGFFGSQWDSFFRAQRWSRTTSVGVNQVQPRRSSRSNEQSEEHAARRNEDATFTVSQDRG